MPSFLQVFTAIFIVGILLRSLAVLIKTHAERLTTFVYSISLQFFRGPSGRGDWQPSVWRCEWAGWCSAWGRYDCLGLLGMERAVVIL